MGEEKKPERSLSRRDALKACLAPAGIAAAHWLVACADSNEKDAQGSDQDDSQTESEGSASGNDRDAGMAGDARAQQADARTGANSNEEDDDGDAAPDLDARTAATSDARTTATGDAGTNDAGGALGDAASGPQQDASASDVPWATGGTKSMQGGYPDPFMMGAAGMACPLYPAQTLGPCYAETTEREDLSDGVAGLPVRLSFLVVSSDGCTPVPNAEVDVWSAGSNGIYSAYPAAHICTGLPNGPNTQGETYCRGKLSTDENGRVDFNTVFPGWYSGRTIHIHFTVRAGGRDYITSQLYFDDALSDEILAQGEYEARGPRDTTNRTDSILRGGGNIQQFLFSTAKRADGVLHAWKVLSVNA